MKAEEIIMKYELAKNDLEKLGRVGINLAKVEEQVNRLKKGTAYIDLDRSCKIGDGIISVKESDKNELLNRFDKAIEQKNIIKFVPASGAASRMFKKLESFMNSGSNSSLEELKSDRYNEFIYTFFSNLSKFAFYNELKDTIKKDGKVLSELLNRNKLKEILEYLLTDKGLGYSKQPKALIKFHQYDDESRTSFEEQILESLHYIKDRKGKVNLHFTISPDFESNFKKEEEKLKKKYAGTVKLNISYSYQKKSTDTLALDSDNKLFRDNDELLFRPGGHGALIENLNEIDCDIILIKNIDNVQREENIELTIQNKKILGGLLVKYQSQIHNYLNELENSSSNELLNKTKRFIENELGYELTNAVTSRETLIYFLNRPIRICGVVVNEGHPGGGPFWVKSNDGRITKQIIESAQVNQKNDKQKEIFNSSTHFNPVDLVCAVKNYKGEKFDLTKYVDNDAVLVAEKSHKGRELKALELPGLWNGAMADWITIFVEVPKETFTPVKEVNDLLKDYHQ